MSKVIIIVILVVVVGSAAAYFELQSAGYSNGTAQSSMTPSASTQATPQSTSDSSGTSYVQAHSRDSRRISFVKQMQTILAGTDAVSTVSTPLSGCTVSYADVRTCTNRGDIGQMFPKMQDPSITGVAGIPGAETCSPVDAGSNGGVSKRCQFSISKRDGTVGATSGNYEICFTLETGWPALGLNASSVYAATSDGDFGVPCQ